MTGRTGTFDWVKFPKVTDALLKQAVEIAALRASNDMTLADIRCVTSYRPAAYDLAFAAYMEACGRFDLTVVWEGLTVVWAEAEASLQLGNLPKGWQWAKGR